MKTLVKVLALSLCMLLCFTSCSLLNKAKEEAQKAKEEVAKVKDFTVDFVEVVKDPSVEKAEDLVHPSSSLTPEDVVNRLKENETIKNLDISKDTSVEFGGFSDLTLLRNDPTLGGNVYGVDCVVNIDGTPVTISLTVLSTSEGMGIYDFDLK